MVAVIGDGCLHSSGVSTVILIDRLEKADSTRGRCSLCMVALRVHMCLSWDSSYELETSLY